MWAKLCTQSFLYQWTYYRTYIISHETTALRELSCTALAIGLERFNRQRLTHISAVTNVTAVNLWINTSTKEAQEEKLEN